MIKRFYGFLFKRISKWFKGYIVFFFFSFSLISLASFFIPLLEKNLINNISISNGFNAVEIVKIIIVTFIMSGFLLFNSKFFSSFYLNISYHMENEFLIKTMSIPQGIVKKSGIQNYQQRIFGDTENIASSSMPEYINLIISIIQAIAILLLTLQWTYSFIFIVLSVYLVNIIVINLCGKMKQLNFEKYREESAGMRTFINDLMQNMQIINQNGNFKHFLNEKKQYIMKVKKIFQKAIMSSMISDQTFEITKMLSIIALIIFAIPQLINKNIQIGELIAMISYLTIIFLPIEKINTMFMYASGNQVCLDRLEHIEENSQYGKINNIALPELKSIPLHLNNICFSYDSKKKYKIDLNINNMVGLVGVSGEGKSTLLKLISGEEKPENGTIKFFGTDINNIPKPILNNMIAFYNQESTLLNDNLEKNICLGKEIVANEDLKEIKLELYEMLDFLTFCKEEKELKNNILSNKSFLSMFGYYPDFLDIEKKQLQVITDFIKNNKINLKILVNAIIANNYITEDKYNLALDCLELRGLEKRENIYSISGGEKQRIALARFLCKENKRFIVIDEPFTSLDSIAEEKLLYILKDEINNYSGVIISHKFNIIKLLSDNIIVLDNGLIAEKGTHKELITNKGLYKELFDKFNLQRIEN